MIEIRRAQRSPTATLFLVTMVNERDRDAADRGFEWTRSTMRLAP